MTARRHELDLEANAGVWSRQLATSQYAGEVVVSEAELPALAKAIRRDLFSERRSSPTNTCLLILAINCMYYHHDEQGFWRHFCRLLDLDDTPHNQSWLGRMLESALLTFQFLDGPGHGPYRYVTPLRGQCGITRTEIPSFADLLSWLSERFGWDGIPALGQAKFSRIVARRLSAGHLSGFLQDAEGYSFVRDVARGVSQFQRRILKQEDLTSLPGYRPGFFAELFDSLGRTPEAAPETVLGAPLPRLLFLPEYRHVGICFDSAAVLKGQYKIDGQIVRRPHVLCKNPHDYLRPITGERRGRKGDWSAWSINNWDPLSRPVALFDVDRGLIDHGTRVPPGEYFLLGPSQSPPPADVLRSEYGAVDLPFPELQVDSWLILVRTSSDLCFLGVETTPQVVADDLIAWSDRKTEISGALEGGVAFAGSLPALSILRPELFTTNAVAIFAEAAETQHRIRVETTAETITVDACPPVQGRIWVEAISRRREFAGRDTLCELRYYLFQNCEIRWPEGLFSLTDEPKVVLSTLDPEMSLQLEDAVPLDDNHRHWRINPKTTIIEGALCASGFSVPIAQRVYRAFLREDNHPAADYFLPDDLEAKALWVASGVPHASADLTLLNGSAAKPLGCVGTFNAAGECRFPLAAIRDTLAQYDSPVARLAVHYSGRDVPTTTVLVRFAELLKWLLSAKGDSAPTWWPILPTELGEALVWLIALRDSAATPLSVPTGINTLPLRLSSFCRTALACAVVFDDAALLDAPGMSPTDVVCTYAETAPRESELLFWYLKAKDFKGQEAGCGTDAGSLLREYHQLQWHPPFPRWQAAVKKAFDHLKAEYEVVPFLREWKDDVENGFRPHYVSYISGLERGRELTEAWIQYNRFGDHAAPAKKAKELTCRAFSPVADLAAILLVICWLRRGLFDSQPVIQYGSTNSKLAAAYSELRSFAQLGAAASVAERPTFASLSPLMVALPLREEDVAMLTSIRDGCAPPCGSNDPDWLHCYYELRFAEAVASSNVRALAAQLRRVVQAVPNSSDRHYVVEALERHP